jgi:hypothetical protein
MRFILLLWTLWAMGLGELLAQAPKTVNVYLKNGSVLKGRLLEEKPKVRLETYDQSVWVFEQADVEKIRTFATSKKALYTTLNWDLWR